MALLYLFKFEKELKMILKVHPAKKTVIADPEVSMTDGTAKPISPTNPTSPTNSTTSINSTSPTVSTINSEEESATDANTGKDKHSARC